QDTGMDGRVLEDLNDLGAGVLLDAMVKGQDLGEILWNPPERLESADDLVKENGLQERLLERGAVRGLVPPLPDLLWELGGRVEAFAQREEAEVNEGSRLAGRNAAVAIAPHTRDGTTVLEVVSQCLRQRPQ